MASHHHWLAVYSQTPSLNTYYACAHCKELGSQEIKSHAWEHTNMSTFYILDDVATVKGLCGVPGTSSVSRSQDDWGATINNVAMSPVRGRTGLWRVLQWSWTFCPEGTQAAPNSRPEPATQPHESSQGKGGAILPCVWWESWEYLRSTLGSWVFPLEVPGETLFPRNSPNKTTDFSGMRVFYQNKDIYKGSFKNSKQSCSMIEQSHSVSMHLDKTIIWKDACTPMSTEALFTTAKTGKQPKCPWLCKWIKLCYIYTMEYYSAIKARNCVICSSMDEPRHYRIKWSKSDKDKYHMISLMCRIQKIYTNECYL